MFSINSVTISGNIIKDAEYIPNSVKVLSFVIAHNVGVKNPANGTWENKAQFIKCKVLGEKACEIHKRNLIKGSPVVVHGKLDIRSYENQEGRKAIDASVVAQDIFAPKK